jgi:glycyl-radical enzyme activating protein
LTSVLRGMVFDIQPFSIHDGPGIRTTVFLKGCPLKCPWCHNPESWARAPQIAWDSHLCIGCGACETACPHGAHVVRDGKHTYDRSLCKVCSRCAEACPSLALERSGREMTVAETLAVVLADKPFFADTGGGLTVSGGEPLMQADFTVALLAAGLAAGIMAAVETSGAGLAKDMDRVARQASLVLYDIKAGPDDYRRLTGIDYDTPYANLSVVKKAGCLLWLRLPLVPGINDTQSHFANVADLAAKYHPQRIEIVPYHALGADKRRHFGLPDASIPARPSADARQVAQWTASLHALGVEARLPGED